MKLFFLPFVREGLTPAANAGARAQRVGVVPARVAPGSRRATSPRTLALAGPGDVLAIEPRQVLRVSPAAGRARRRAGLLSADRVRRAGSAVGLQPDAAGRVAPAAVARAGRRRSRSRACAWNAARRARARGSCTCPPIARAGSCPTSPTRPRGRTRRSRARRPARSPPRWRRIPIARCRGCWRRGGCSRIAATWRRWCRRISPAASPASARIPPAIRRSSPDSSPRGARSTCRRGCRPTTRGPSAPARPATSSRWRSGCTPCSWTRKASARRCTCRCPAAPPGWPSTGKRRCACRDRWRTGRGVPPAAVNEIRTALRGGTNPPILGPSYFGEPWTDARALTPIAAWAPEVNLTPMLRAAAGLGADVVRAEQDALVEAARTQLDAFTKAQREGRRRQLATAFVNRVALRLAAAPVKERQRVTAPMAVRQRQASDVGVYTVAGRRMVRKTWLAVSGSGPAPESGGRSRARGHRGDSPGADPRARAGGAAAPAAAARRGRDSDRRVHAALLAAAERTAGRALSRVDAPGARVDSRRGRGAGRDERGVRRGVPRSAPTRS